MPGSYELLNDQIRSFITGLLPRQARILSIGSGEDPLFNGHFVVAPKTVTNFWCTYEEFDLAVVDLPSQTPDQEVFLAFLEKKNIPTLCLGQGFNRRNYQKVSEGCFFHKKTASDFEEFCSDVAICVTTYNRKKITKIVLANLNQTKRGAGLFIYDDHSSEFDLKFLQEAAPSATVIRPAKKLGVELLRIHLQKEILQTPYKHIYHTDNDALHDPFWLNRIYEMRKEFDGAIGLYNTIHHFKRTIQTDPAKKIVYRSACPGVSFFYSNDAVRPFAHEFENYRGSPSWDFFIGDALGQAAISEVSYVEHFGAGGIHNSSFDGDRAHNPTPWLSEQRKAVIESLR